jgi:hypothetical protein
MELIEPHEMKAFQAILKSHHMDTADFSFSEIDTTDPKSDEILPLQGLLTVTRTSTGRSNRYSIGDGMSWVKLFQKDVEEGVFG